MATQACLDNIKKETPPVYCPGDLCGSIQGKINKYCKHMGLGGDVPVPQVGPNGDCWCCCSCVAWGTPVEVSPGSYLPVESITDGMRVLATGGTMQEWQEELVTSVGGIAPGVELDFCYTAFFKLADGQQRIIVSTADHLYLIPGGVLKPVQDLRPGDDVLQANGKMAKVATILAGQFSGGVRNFSLGPFDPKKHPNDPYKGHLINTFGLVTADLAVQTAYYAGNVSTKLLASHDADLPQIGSASFFEKYDTTLYQEVIRNPALWPQGFKALAPTLINIPPSALAYFTPEQAEDIFQSDKNQNLGNSLALANFKFLRSLFRGFYPNLYYVADWTNEVPNAWYFNSADQNYVVLSGGLLRLKELDVTGLTFILSHLVAQSQGYGCTGEADYWGAALYLREIWFGRAYLENFRKGYEQIASIFSLVKPDHAQPNPANICAAPGLECRLLALTSASSFQDVPDCALPPPTFAVIEASAPDLNEVKVGFSAKLFAGSATFPENYAIKSAQVLQVRVSEDDESVVLSVQGLLSATSYRVVVSNVVSARGQFLSPEHDAADFTTP